MSDTVMTAAPGRTPAQPSAAWLTGLWIALRGRLDTTQALTVGVALGVLAWEAAWVVASAVGH